MRFYIFRYYRVLLLHYQKSITKSNFISPAIHAVNRKPTITIKHCRKSLFYDKTECWKKEITNTCFNVTMGKYRGAEICALVRTYILSLLSDFIDKNNCGLYRDDGLILLKRTSGQNQFGNWWTDELMKI